MIATSRLQLSQFQMSDAKEVFACCTPNVTRYMAEALGGQIIDTRTNPKYESVVYNIPRTA